MASSWSEDVSLSQGDGGPLVITLASGLALSRTPAGHVATAFSDLHAEHLPPSRFLPVHKTQSDHTQDALNLRSRHGIGGVFAGAHTRWGGKIGELVAAVETLGERLQLARHVRGVDQVVGAVNGSLDITEHCVDPPHAGLLGTGGALVLTGVALIQLAGPQAAVATGAAGAATMATRPARIVDASAHCASLP